MIEVQDYIIYPNETLSVEYKRWLDLSLPDNRANIARHIAAISNHGGGFIIFGFDDATLKSMGDNPFDQTLYSHDGIASISKRYLDPALHCDVINLIGSEASHTVVAVPSHGRTPVCAKADGPITNGKPKGIVSGTYYIRKVGPESAPITSSADWTDLIRRCVMHDRSSLLAALGAALAPPKEVQPDMQQLTRWHDAASNAYIECVHDQSLPKSLYERSTHLSYQIVTADRERLPEADLIEIVRQINAEMRDRVNTGWSLFFPFSRSPIDPYFTTDLSTGSDTQFLEQNLLLEYDGGANADFWRISADGRATTLRPIRSDFLDYKDWKDAKYFSPNNAAREVGELVRHAEGLCSRYREPITVQFRCEWLGLAERMISDPNADWSPGRVARSNAAIASGEWPALELCSRWPEIVSTLIAPLLRVFATDFHLSPEWVARAADQWRPLGNHYP